jgi:hypothetical protein
MDYGWVTLKGNSPLPFGLLFLCDFPPVCICYPKAQLTHRKRFIFPIRIPVACVFYWPVVECILIVVPATILELAVDERQCSIRKHFGRSRTMRLEIGALTAAWSSEAVSSRPSTSINSTHHRICTLPRLGAPARRRIRMRPRTLKRGQRW